MHARCYPFTDHSKNVLKLGTELALMVVFLATAVLRSVDTKQGLVDTGHLKEGDLTAEDRRLPGVLSVIMVLASVGIPFGILIWNCFDHAAEKDVVEKAGLGTMVMNPVHFDVEIEDEDSDSDIGLEDQVIVIDGSQRSCQT